MFSNRIRNKLFLAVYIVISFVSVLLLLNFVASAYYKQACREKVSEVVNNGTHKLYLLTVKDLHLNFLQGDIKFEEVNIIPDDKIYRQLKITGVAPKNLYYLHAKTLHISFSQLYRTLFEGLLHIGELRLDEPVISIRNDSVTGSIKPAEPVMADLPLTRGLLRLIQIDNLILSHGQLTYLKTGHIKDETFTCKSRQVNFQAENILIDKNSFKQSAALFFDRQNFSLSLYAFSFNRQPGLYAYTARKIRISKADNELRIEGLQMLPQFTVPKFKLEPDDRPVRDFMTLDIDNISMKVSAFFRMLKAGTIDIPSIVIDGADFRYNSDGISAAGVKKYDMPQEFIRKLKTKFKIDSIDIHHGTIVYQDYSANTHKNGCVIFNDINGMVSHLSNDSAYLQKHKSLDIAIRTRLYNKGKVQLNFSFDMQSKTDSFRYSGIMGYFPLTVINQITVPLSSLQIMRGNADNCWFDVCADQREASGQLTGNYHNLYIKLLADDTSRAALHKMKTLSSLANMFMVLNDNPLINEPVRTEEIFTKRDENRSFFRYLWRSLLSGLKPTIGMQKGREENFTSSIAKIQHFTTWHRSGREARINRRANRRHLRKLVRDSHKNSIN